MTLGIDFDNTIICYDAVFHRLAVEAGLLSPDAPPRQKAVREAARQSAEGDVAWQRLQGQAYGPRIQEATPAPGVLAFLAKARGAGLDVHIISHKTRFASIDPTGTDLQAAAAAWLARHNFFSEETGLDETRFHCGATRQEKIALIQGLGCTHFVDDLVETFREAAFPTDIQPILYAPGGEPAPEDLPRLWVARSWEEIARRLRLV